MKGWVVSIVCVIVLGVLLEIVLPKGKITKYVKGVFSLVVIFVIIAPLPKLLKQEWKFDFSSAWANVSTTFVDETKNDFLVEKAEETEEYLAYLGYDCEIELKNGDEYFEISACEITFFGESKDVDEVVKLVSEKLGINPDRIKLVLKQKIENDV